MMPTWQMHWISAGLFPLDWDSHKNNEIEKFQAIPGISQFAWKFLEIPRNYMEIPGYTFHFYPLIFCILWSGFVLQL